jgi:hypothetical protein
MYMHVHTHTRTHTHARTHMYVRALACTCSSEGKRPSHRPHWGEYLDCVSLALGFYSKSHWLRACTVIALSMSKRNIFGHLLSCPPQAIHQPDAKKSRLYSGTFPSFYGVLDTCLTPWCPLFYCLLMGANWVNISGRVLQRILGEGLEKNISVLPLEISTSTCWPSAPLCNNLVHTLFLEDLALSRGGGWGPQRNHFKILSPRINPNC